MRGDVEVGVEVGPAVDYSGWWSCLGRCGARHAGVWAEARWR
jgi:hypothetical protein